jgi:hypothetical protein
MFNRATAPVVELTCDESSHLEPLIPLSVLSLDLGEAPAEGWSNFLAARGVDVVTDDLGRLAVTRDAARTLFDGHRADEERKAQRRKLAEAQAVADDQIRRSRIWQGVPAVDLPPGMSASSVMLAAAKGAQPKRVTPLQEALAGESLTYHSYGSTPEDDS